MFEIKTEIEINKSVEKVWSVLVETSEYPKWNPFIQSIRGEIREESSIEIFIKPVGEKGMTFKPRVKICEAPKELCWIGKLVVPGLFTGEHIFKIEEINSNKVRFIHQEIFTGVLVPFMKSKLNNGTRRGFEEMNKALKDYVENKSRNKGQ